MVDTIGAADHHFLGITKIIVVDVVPINDGNGWRGFIAIDKLSHCDAVHHVVVKRFIGSEQTLIEHRATQLRDEFINRCGGQSMGFAFKLKPALGQLLAQHLTQNHLVGFSCTLFQRLIRRHIAPAQIV